MADFAYTVKIEEQGGTLEQLGGKALNLSRLVRNGFNVPPGFVVTVKAYREFVKENQLTPKMKMALSRVDAVNSDNDDDGDDLAAVLEEVSGSIRQAFVSQVVSSQLSQEIERRLSQLDTTAVAVRSSATTEDLPDMSFAGQQDTYLNVQGTSATIQAVVDCFASLFTARAIGYRHRNSISHLQAGIAVIIQVMVPSDQSGVLFTANPLTGQRTQSVLEVVPGLGEGLVSGLVEPDRFIINKDGTITEKHVGAKTMSIRSKAGGGVCHVKEEELSSSTAALDDHSVQELVQTGRKIESLFDGTPQDIEWAISQGSIFILQSRPVTALFPLPDNVSEEPLQVMLSYGAIQGVTLPITPLGRDTLLLFFAGSSSILYGTRGMAERSQRSLCVAADRLYVNFTPIVLNSVGRYFLDTVWLPLVEPGIAAGLKQVEDDPRLAVTGGLSARFMMRVFSAFLPILPKIVFTVFFPDRARETVVAHADQVVANAKQQCDEARNLEELLSVHERIFQNFVPDFLFPIFIPRMPVIMGCLVHLRRMAAKVPGANDLVLTLTRGLPHNVTTEMDLQLWDVAKQIRGNSQAIDWFRSFEADVLANQYLTQQLPAIAQTAIEGFMKKYGMRGFVEVDIGRPRWREDPSPVMQALKSYLDIKEDRAPDRMFAAGEKAAMDAALSLEREIGRPGLVRFLVQRLRALAGIRELPKFTIVQCMGVLRERMLQEAEHLVKLNVLSKPNDLFILHLDEMKALAAGNGGGWKSLVASRRAHLDYESKRKRVPQCLMSDGFAYYGGAAPEASRRNEGDGDFVYGEPVSPGVAEGKVRVVLDPSCTKLSPGEVLVCPGTDPSWTPLFLLASALVTEVGGLMTHGSVVAREYGIPAVVGVAHVTEKLKTGQTIRVDGSSGIVEIVNESSSG